MESRLSLPGARTNYLNKENDRRTSIASTTKKPPFASRIATPSTRPISDRTAANNTFRKTPTKLPFFQTNKSPVYTEIRKSSIISHASTTATTTTKPPFVLHDLTKLSIIARNSTSKPSIYTGTTTTDPINSPYVTRNNTALTNSSPFDACATISKRNSQAFNRTTTSGTFPTIESPVINRTVAVPTKSPPVARRASSIPTTKLPVTAYSTNSPAPPSRTKVITDISPSPKKRKKVVYDDDRNSRNVRPKKFGSFASQILKQNQEMITKTQKLEQDYKNIVISGQNHEAELMKVSAELIETKNDCENMERRLREEKNQIKKLLEEKEELENDIKRLKLESKRFDIFNELEDKMNRG